MNKFLKSIFVIAGALVALFLLIQLVPYGRNHSNPPVVQEPNWDSPATRELAKTACFDCHSNESVWPWYSNIAPASWLVQRDVEEARAEINFSEWTGSAAQMRKVDDLFEVVEESAMPPVQYLLLHAEANLSAEQRQQLLEGFQRTFQ
ncbi:MAG: cytochrome C [Chloroflexi bacterium HGW-Chloroflexi-10]|nr:MAG: cytochrome C [Chloroflexi bacterium HGW-Chloroflexi-10]